MIDSAIKTEQQLLPPNLRLNDNILSIHFRNVTSNVSTNNNNHHHLPAQPIQIRDDSTNQMLTDTKILPVPMSVVAYENLIDKNESSMVVGETSNNSRRRIFTTKLSRSMSSHFSFRFTSLLHHLLLLFVWLTFSLSFFYFLQSKFE